MSGNGQSKRPWTRWPALKTRTRNTLGPELARRPRGAPRIVARAFFRVATSIAVALALLFGPTRVAAEPTRPNVADLPGARAVLAGEEVSRDAGSIPELSPPHPSPLLGRPVRAVQVVSLGGRWPARIALKSVHIGDPFVEEQARRLLREALATDSVARAAVDAVPEGDGVRLIVSVLPRRIIMSVKITGGVLDTNETLDAAGVQEGAEVTATLLPRIAERVRKLYESRGFPEAHVVVDTSDIDDPSASSSRSPSNRVVPGASPSASSSSTLAPDRELGDLKEQYKLGQRRAPRRAGPRRGRSRNGRSS